MFLTGDPTFGSFALATIMVVAIAVLGSLTVLPALLARLGDTVNRIRIPLLHRLQRPGGGRLWPWLLDRVLRRPLLSALASAAILVALALPALGMNTVDPGIDALPQSFEAVQAYNRLQDAFSGEQAPAVAVVKAPSIDDPDVDAAIGELRRQAVASGAAHEPVTMEVSPDRTVARIELPLAGTGSDDASLAALETLRETVVPATVGALPGVEAGITGDTAVGKDFDDALRRSAPLVLVFVLAFAFLLLLVSFRSVVIAAKAIVLNLLSVAAAYGILVLVFQHGWGRGLLGFDYTGGVVVWLPVFLFVILFGLSMDYHVFIISRIREAYDGGMRTDDAIAHGIKSTAGVVTSAAIVMVFVFSIFGTLSLIMMKQFGVGLAAAVLIDATIVRAVLLPSTMTLLGDWNWYLPAWLRWLPRLELEGSAVPPTPQPAPAPERRRRRLRALFARARDARPTVVPSRRLAGATPHASISFDLLRVPFASTWLGSHATAMTTVADRTAFRRTFSSFATVIGGLAVLLTLIWALSTPGAYFWPAQAILPFVLALGIAWWVLQVDERPEIRGRLADSRSIALHAGVSAALWLYVVAQWVLSGGGTFWPGWVLLALGILFAVHVSVVLVRRDHRRRDRIEALETTRAGAVDLQETELRRIERDLHDGAQARLVALGMSLGMAEETLATDPEAARRHLAEARSGAREALEELRDLARGIHPPILTDRGLEAAVRALAARTPLRVDVSVELDERPRAAIETAAYFVVAEALANAAKHAEATVVAIDIHVEDGTLVAEVRDDGRGGADAAGSGLTGLRRRVAALDGSLRVTSVTGGPTVVRAELPCAS
jgi:signal transduction histidine kinase